MYFYQKKNMSLANSFINQIGRELGRDAYSSVRSPEKSLNRSILDFSNESVLRQVIDFELQTNDESTYRLLVNLVEKAEHTDPQDFEWQDLFYELENKINFCKTHLAEAFKTSLEELAIMNKANYKIVKEKHIAYVGTVINHFEAINSSYQKKNITLAYLFMFFGLRAAYFKEKVIFTILKVVYVFFLGFIFVNGMNTYYNPTKNSGNLPNKTLSDSETIQTTGIMSVILALFFYFLFILIGLIKISKFKKEIQRNLDSKVKFENYKTELSN